MHLDFNDSQLIEKLETLKPISGLCIFIDVCGSTAIKSRSFKEWVILIGNTLRMCSDIPGFKSNIVKLIDDEVMFFLPDKKIEELNENYLTVFYLLKGILGKFNSPLDKIILPTKCSIHYCSDVYNINFKDNADDFYGNDIDFTARLMGKASEGKIVISDEFHEKLIEINPNISIETSASSDFKGLGIKSYKIVNVT